MQRVEWRERLTLLWTGGAWRGIVALVVALVGIACASILLVFAEQDMSPYAATFNRLALATLVFALWNGGQGLAKGRSPLIASTPASSPQQSGKFALSSVDLSLFGLAGLAFSLSLSLWAWSLTQTSVANSTLLNNMMPIFTTVGAWLVFRQTFRPLFLGGMAIAITGAVIIGIEDLQVSQGIVGDIAALGAALLSAVNILTVKQLRQRFETPAIMMWTSLIGSMVVGLGLIMSHQPLLPTTTVGWLSVLGLALISQALGQGLLTYCLKQFSATVVAVSMLTIPVMAAVLAMVLFAERLSPLNWFAFGVVLWGIYLAISASRGPSLDPQAEAALEPSSLPQVES